MSTAKWLLRVLMSLVVLVASALPAGAVGGPGDGFDDPVIRPGNGNCPEEDWPFYYYRLPVIFQDITDVGTVNFVAFGYADGCKKSGKGQRGGTFANIMELPGVWQPDVLERMKRLQLAPVEKVLPGLDYPGNNMLTWDLPDIPTQFQSLYNREAAARVCPTEPELVCPGIPPEFGSVLADAKYRSMKDGAGYTRWLVDSSHADATAAWFLSGLPTADGENFYFRHPGEDMKLDHSDGGLFRVVLHPVNLALDGVPETTPMTGGDSAIIPATIHNESSQSRLVTTIGWRPAEQISAPWHSVNQWHPKGEQAWRLPQQQIRWRPMRPSISKCR